MDQENNTRSIKQKIILPWIITILIAAWLIGMSILGAGYLVSKEIAKNGVTAAALLPSPTPAPTPVNIDVLAGVPVLGNNNAKVTVVEYADFQCPFCKEWQQLFFKN